MDNIRVEQSEINEALEQGNALKSLYGGRDDMFDAITNMYQLDWELKHADAVVQKTVNPDPRNAVEGAVRLLTSTEPVWKAKVLGEDNDGMADKLESAAQQMWLQSARQNRKAPHRDMVRSAVLYDEVHVAINSMKDWADQLKAAEAKKQYQRVVDASKRTPFTFTVWNPRNGYPMFDGLGLCGYFRELRQSVKGAAREYGAVVMGIADKRKLNANDLITLKLWYDLDKFVVWVADEPVWAEEWKLPFLPIDVTVVEGSALFDGSEDSRNPLLKAVWKSGMWENQNITGSALFTDIKKYGLGPMWKHQRGGQDPEAEVELDWNRGMAKVPQGHDLSALDRGHLFSPEVREGMMLAERKMEESSLYKTALGQNIGSGAAFSTVALLSQAGRLPLVATKEQVGEAIGSIMEKALRWYKVNGEDCATLEVRPSEVPEDFELTVNLEIDLPQDKLQAANTGVMLVNNQLTDRAWVQEELLHITNPSEMQSRIWKDQARGALFETEVRKIIEQMQMMAQQQAMEQQQAAAMQGGQGGQPPQGMPMQGDMRGMPVNPEGGAAMQGGLPQAQAGMIPQMGPGDSGAQGMPSVDNPIKGRRLA